MKIFFFLLILFINLTRSNFKDTCILSKLVSYTKLHSLKDCGKNTDSNDITIKSLSSKGNLNQMMLMQNIIMNYDILPDDLKEEINNCENDLSILIHKCEKFHGVGNCDVINKFTVGQKCPEGYKRDDHTRCVRDCENSFKHTESA